MGSTGGAPIASLKTTALDAGAEVAAAGDVLAGVVEVGVLDDEHEIVPRTDSVKITSNK